MNSLLLRRSLHVGSTYFVWMAVAHYLGLKLPLLFIYWNTPYHAYQDKIISFAVIAYVALFEMAARSRAAVLPALIVLATTIAGLSAVNLSEDLAKVLEPGQSTWPYWAQTGGIAVYFVWLLALFVRQGGARAPIEE